MSVPGSASEDPSSTNSEPTISASPAVMQPAVPRRMLIFTGIVLSAIGLSVTLISYLEDLLSIGLDVVMVLSVVLMAVLLLAWVVWFLALSRWQWWQRIAASVMVAASPFLFLALFRPVNGGDANIERFEPIWSRHRTRPSASIEVETTEVDLVTETPQDFPQFLGPTQDGVIRTGISVDAEQFPNSQIVWKQPIGSGWSGFTARNGYAVTMEQRESKECVTCYEIVTGKLMWIYQHPARHQDRMNLGRVGPRATPTISDGKVFAVGAVGNFVCLDGVNGKPLWQVNLNELLEIKLQTGTDADGNLYQFEGNSSLSWGRSGSPLIAGPLVIVPGGGPKGGPRTTLLAFDRQTGELRWRGGEEMIAYGSPVLANVAGINQILLVTETKAMGFEATTGRQLWSFPRPGESDGGANTSQLTLVSANQVLTSKGYPDGGGELIELSASGDTLAARSVWKNTAALKTKLMSPLLQDGFAWSLSNGFLECTQLDDGERLWKARGRFGHGQMLLVNNHLLLHSESGTLHLIDASPDEYRDIASIPTISGVCWNTLCLFGDHLLIRSELEAACIRLPVAAAR